MKKIFSLEEKLTAIKLVKQGQSARSAAKQFHVGRNMILEWLAEYKINGIKGLKPKGKRKKKVSYEKKCKIVREYK